MEQQEVVPQAPVAASEEAKAKAAAEEEEITMAEDEAIPDDLDFDNADYGEDGTSEDKLPEWTDEALPPTLKIPVDAQVTFIRFKKDWTLKPSKGDRVIVLWPITVKEEKIAYKRARGEQAEVVDQLTMMAVRAIDGEVVTPEMHSRMCNNLWADLGLKCVTQLRNWYARTHSLPMEQRMDFFGSCIVVRSAVAG